MKNILIVDDTKTITTMLKRTLSKKYNVMIYNDSLSILKNSESYFKNLDLAILDYIMPGLNGIQLAKKIREYNSELPIIIITAVHNIEIEDLHYGIKNLEVLFKPFNTETLIDTVYKIMNQ